MKLLSKVLCKQYYSIAAADVIVAGFANRKFIP